MSRVQVPSRSLSSRDIKPGACIRTGFRLPTAPLFIFTMNELDYAYAAGIVDGEGSILIEQGKAPGVSVTNTSLAMLEFLQSLFGGSIRKQKTYKSHHRPAWVWSIKYDRALRMLDCILPYMKEEDKIHRATILIDEWKDATPRNGKYTEAQSAIKANLIERFYLGLKGIRLCG